MKAMTVFVVLILCLAWHLAERRTTSLMPVAHADRFGSTDKHRVIVLDARYGEGYPYQYTLYQDTGTGFLIFCKDEASCVVLGSEPVR